MSVSNFPKNLYLLNLNKEKDDEDSGQVKRTSGHGGSTPEKISRNNDSEPLFCESHNKKVEAYCMM